ncbi:hypothetical protein CQ017_17530 [Arthrobacter sp. MYb224]|nr:hypothetical protein CQ017_17530 [Arthrobacter sp. MYb224]
MLSTLDSIFEEDDESNPEFQRVTRKHAALLMELEALDNNPANPLNLVREDIVTDLLAMIEEMKRQHDKSPSVVLSSYPPPKLLRRAQKCAPCGSLVFLD